jgi:hypothetical protein
MPDILTQHRSIVETLQWCLRSFAFEGKKLEGFVGFVPPFITVLVFGFVFGSNETVVIAVKRDIQASQRWDVSLRQ